MYSPDNLSLGQRPLFIFTLAGLLLYGLTHFYRLASFPVFFFCDEAFVGIATRQLIDNYFRSDQGLLFPLYWEKAPGRQVPHILSYFAVLPTLLWPRSVEALRAITGVIGLLAAGIAHFACIRALSWKRFGWLPLYLITIIPVLFLHSRLAFETTHAIFFYLMMLSFYACYIRLHPAYGAGVLLSCLAMWYSHWSGTIVCAACIALFLVSDFRLHLRRWRWTCAYAIMFLVGMTPMAIWYFHSPSAVGTQLAALHGGSNPFDTSLRQPLSVGLQRYLNSIDPQYWFTYWNDGSQVRHLWLDRPFISQWIIIPFLVGLFGCFWKGRNSFFRALPLALFAGATPVFVVESHVQRVFYLLAPLLLITIYGIDLLFLMIVRAIPRIRIFPAAACLAVMLIGQGLVMLKEAMVEAPLWFREYGLYGIPWGATQLFTDTIPEILDQNPNLKIVPSSDWANGAHIFPEFFLDAKLLPRVVSPPFNIFLPKPGQSIPDDLVFVLIRPERERIEQSGKFLPIKPIAHLPYPDNSEGFTFTRLQYVENIDAIVAEERKQMSQPETAEILLWGRSATVTFSRLDMGEIGMIGDGAPGTLARGMSANPFVLEIDFSKPLPLRGMRGIFFPMELRWRAEIFGVNGVVLSQASATESGVDSRTDTESELIFGDTSFEAKRLRITVTDLRASPGEDTHIHLRELIPYE